MPARMGVSFLRCEPPAFFCRPSCHSKRALRKNVRFFANAQQALDAGFRPCKRCQPDNARAQQRRLDKIACACRLLEQETPVTLASLAQAVAMSPFHLHRLFKASTGMTPKGWQQAWRARRLREALAKGEPITAAIYRAASRIAVATTVMPTRRWA